VQVIDNEAPAALATTPAPRTPAQPLGNQRPTRNRWAWLIVLSVGLGLFEIVSHVFATTHNPNVLPSLILLGAVAIPAAFVTFIYGLRLDYDVDAATLVLVALVGGVIGVVTAGLIEYDTLQRLGTLPTIAVALAEETAKLLAPLAILLFTRHRRRSDGLLIGVACGAGFAVMETMGYSAVALAQSHQNLAAVENLLLQRGFFSPATHMAWTGLTAAALWHAAGQRWRPRSVALLAASFPAAVALHTAWDTASTTPAYVLIAAISLGLLAITSHKLRHL
jgi:protease PrsW